MPWRNLDTARTASRLCMQRLRARRAAAKLAATALPEPVKPDVKPVKPVKPARATKAAAPPVVDLAQIELEEFIASLPPR